MQFTVSFSLAHCHFIKDRNGPHTVLYNTAKATTAFQIRKVEIVKHKSGGIHKVKQSKT